MRLLVLPRYGRLGASSRLRLLQFFPYFKSQGLQITLKPLFGDAYVSNLYAHKSNLWQVFIAYLKRLWDMRLASRNDALIAEKELFPWLPAFFEMLFIPKRVKLVLDYDDAVFHRYDEHKSALVRRMLGRKLDTLMKRADLVLAGNEYLAQRARSAGCRWVEIVPTVIDLTRYPVRAEKTANESLTIGWIGSPATADYLRQVAKSVASIARDHAVKFVAIGARPDQVADTPFEPLAWTEDTEVASIQSFDIGIMPLPDAPWERGKCGYKLIQYMACGLPVIASPVGVNAQIVKQGINGFLAATDQEWLDALTVLLQDGDLRQKLGRAGRNSVESEYCLQVIGPRLVSLFRTLDKMEFNQDG
jgi:glycosyltransferase involved in cell wall biosynthesis